MTTRMFKAQQIMHLLHPELAPRYKSFFRQLSREVGWGNGLNNDPRSCGRSTAELIAS